MGYYFAMQESNEPTIRTAQGRFLIIGLLVVIVLAALLALLNNNVKEETEFQQKLELQQRTGEVAPMPTGGLGYAPAVEDAPLLPDPLNPSTPQQPEASALPEPTTPVAPAE